MYSTLDVTIPTAGISVDLISLNDAKLALGITGTDRDSLIQEKITRASSTIASLCDRSFGAANVVETFVFEHHEMSRTICLSRFPVNSISEVAVDGTTLDDMDYRLDESGLLHRTSHHWRGIIAITYNGGYELPDGAPAALSEACVLLMKDDILLLGHDPSVREVQHGDTRVQFWSGTANTTPQAVMTLIAPFRRW